MEDKIFDILTDLLREEITKTEAIDKLLILHNVNNLGFYCQDAVNTGGFCHCSEQCNICQGIF